MKREEIRWVPRKPNCEGGHGFVSVGITEIKPALMLLLGGYMIAVIMIVIEILNKKIQLQIVKKFDKIHYTK